MQLKCKLVVHNNTMINIMKGYVTNNIHITKFNISEYKCFAFSNRKCKLPDFCTLQHRVNTMLHSIHICKVINTGIKFGVICK